MPWLTWQGLTRDVGPDGRLSGPVVVRLGGQCSPRIGGVSGRAVPRAQLLLDVKQGFQDGHREHHLPVLRPGLGGRNHRL